MRVTNGLMFKNGVQAMQQQQQDLLKVQEQSVSGNAMMRPSDDPSALYRHLVVSADLSGVQSLKKTTQFAGERLTLADTHMSQIHDTLLNAQDLVLKMGESSTGGNPSIFKAEAQQPLSWYKDIMNSANAQLDEVPLFGGGKQQPPFSETNLMATTVRVQSAGRSSLSEATVPQNFVPSVTPGSVPDNMPLQVRVTSQADINQYEVTINDVNGSTSTSTATLNDKGVLDLGNGIEVKLTEPSKTGDVYAFNVVANKQGTAEVQPQETVVASLTPGTVPSDLPVSVQVTYLAASNQFQADINGVKQPPVTLDANSQLDLGHGMKLTLNANPQTGDVYYFEVVPKYQGGFEDRPVRVQSGAVLPGNVTGQELLEGSGPYGKGANILGAMAALRGALLRADPKEVALQLNRVQLARGQVSDMQGVTGIRSTQVDAIHNTLGADETTLSKLKADNLEVDVFKVMSDLQQTSQAMQLLTSSERQVLNTSLIDFIQ
ncbi:MAG: hypothetical protein H7839_08040 [Magnetococcus sp. YQC-5]